MRDTIRLRNWGGKYLYVQRQVKQRFHHVIAPSVLCPGLHTDAALKGAVVSAAAFRRRTCARSTLQMDSVPPRSPIELHMEHRLRLDEVSPIWFTGPGGRMIRFTSMTHIGSLYGTLNYRLTFELLLPDAQPRLKESLRNVPMMRPKAQRSRSADHSTSESGSTPGSRAVCAKPR